MTTFSGALETLKGIAKHQPELSSFIAETEKSHFEMDRRLGVIREESPSPRRTSKERRVAKVGQDDGDENVFQMGGLRNNKEPEKPSVPLEKQKMAIVNTLVGMSDEIRRFSDNIEGKLDKAHKSSQKFDKKPGDRPRMTNIEDILEAHSYYESKQSQQNHLGQKSREGKSREGIRSGRLSSKMDSEK